MAFTTRAWKVSVGQLTELSNKKLDSEKRLEDWLAKDLGLLGADLLLIARQISTPAGRIDLLAMDDSGGLVVIELKKDKTPREVVAQVLDYGSWVARQTYETIAELFSATHGKPISAAFQEQFEFPIPEEACRDHRLVIVASELDESSERIVNYLADSHELDINVVFFNVFDSDGNEYVTRAWLTDPEEQDERREYKKPRPWSGLYFVNVGMDHPDDPPMKNGRFNGRHWEHCRKLGYLTAGGAPKWWKPLHKLQLGDKVVAYVKKAGYVGYGEVAQKAQPVHEYRLGDGRILNDALNGCWHNDPKNIDTWSHAVGIRWIKTVPIVDAKWFEGAFAKPPVVCRIRDAKTADFLAREFDVR